MKRPTFFISSTIYDFSDLRSAMKFFLEKQGCKVLASEYNDFQQPLDLHSYQACLENIKKADYFVLLIGSRVGGWFDEDSKISITMREYREAYELHKTGKIQLINFIRSEVWHWRSNRSEVARALDNERLDKDRAERILNSPSICAEDPDFIVSFIDEVARKAETEKAASGRGAFPTGNWIHAFDGFQDIADVLQGRIYGGLPLDQAVVRDLVLQELKDILRLSLVKIRPGSIYSPTSSLRKFHYKHKLTLNSRDNRCFPVATKRWDILCTLAVALLGLDIKAQMLSVALSSAVFLDFDPTAGRFVSTEIYWSLAQLQEELYKLRKGATPENLAVIFEHTPKRRPRGVTSVDVDTRKLVGLLHVMERWSNVIELSKAICHHLAGGQLHIPELFGRSPIEGMDEQLKIETVSASEVDAFIKGDI